MNQETNPTNNQSNQQFISKSKVSSTRRDTVLQFILSLVVPPVGLLVLIYVLLKKRPIRWIGILAIVVGIIAGTLIYVELNNIRLTRASQYSYKIDNNPAKSFTWIGNKNGTFGFDKPSEFSQTFRKTEQAGTDTAIYTHKSSKGYAIGFIGASVSDGSKLAQDQTYIDGVKYLMTHPAGDNYGKYTGYFTAFVSGFIGSNYQVELGSPQPFSNKNIKDKAWIFDLSATTPTDKKLAPLQGKFVYIISGKNFHDFAILTTKDDWRSNITTWSQMLDSLKVY